MGSPTLYWYPQGATSPEAITIGQRVSDLQVQAGRWRRTTVAGGIPVSGDLGGFRTVRIVKEKLTGAAVIRSLRSLETHLLRGGSVAFSLDHVRTWGGWASSNPQRGDTTVTIDDSAFTAFSSSGAVATGVLITIESPNPEHLREVALVSSVSGNTITLDGSVVQTYDQGPVFIRYQDWYPILTLPPQNLSQASLVTERRLFWDFDVTLIEYPGAIEALAEAYGSLGDGNFSDLDQSPDAIMTIQRAAMQATHLGTSQYGLLGRI